MHDTECLSSRATWHYLLYLLGCISDNLGFACPDLEAWNNEEVDPDPQDVDYFNSLTEYMPSENEDVVQDPKLFVKTPKLQLTSILCLSP